MKRLYSDHFKKLLLDTQKYLDGPASISMTDNFWGGRYLTLQTFRIPKFEGLVESRAIYSNDSDPFQNTGILRSAVWNARDTWEQLVEDSNLTREISIATVMPVTKFVAIEMEQIQAMTRLLEACSIPVKTPEGIEYTGEVYQFSIERGDRTSLKTSWGIEWNELYSPITKAWLTIWGIMGELLINSDSMTCTENW